MGIWEAVYKLNRQLKKNPEQALDRDIRGVQIRQLPQSLAMGLSQMAETIRHGQRRMIGRRSATRDRPNSCILAS